MPKTCSEAFEKKRVLRSNLYLIQGAKDDNDMCKIIGKKSPLTWMKRKLEPGTMTLDELFSLCKAAQVDPAAVITKELRLG